MTPIEINEIPGPLSDRPQVAPDAPTTAGLPPQPVHSGKPSGIPLWGVYPAVVIDTQDKDQMGQIQVQLPWATDPDGNPLEVWARLAAPLAGQHYGAWLPPEPGTEVLVAFEHGQPGRPYVIGRLWNGVDQPPATAASERVISTPGGLKITFDESQSTPELSIETPGGRMLLLSDAQGKTTLQDSQGTQIELTGSEVSLKSNNQVRIEAISVTIDAHQVTINSGMVRVSGVLQADTVITNSVISASYTPGAGNIW